MGDHALLQGKTSPPRDQTHVSYMFPAFPGGWLRGESVCLQGRRPGFNPWVRKIPWERKWQPTPIGLLGKIPWREEPGRLQSTGSQSQTRLSNFSSLPPGKPGGAGQFILFQITSETHRVGLPRQQNAAMAVFISPDTRALT